jgi:leader peptidase (prepilin peptidase)/N-methyltransferase
MLLFSFESVTGMPDVVGYIFIFALGAIIGSFLNVVIHRVPNEESVVFPNSACPKCETAIKPYDNIPILSWLLLGGKCRACKTPISPRYVAVEALTGVLFVACLYKLGFTPFLPVGLIFVAAVVALIFIDAEHMILPNVITYPGIVLAFLARLIFPLMFGAAYFSDLSVAPLADLQMPVWPVWVVSLIGAVLGALVGGGSLWLVGAIWKRLRGVDAMGLGDVKMMFGVGALLGWRLTILTIFLGALSGSVIGLAVMRKTYQTGSDSAMQARIPFGIFLGLGAIIALLFGDQIVNWYVSTFVPA